jgi:hypothetical protein
MKGMPVKSPLPVAHLLLGSRQVLGETIDLVALVGNLVVDVAEAASLGGAAGSVGL